MKRIVFSLSLLFLLFTLSTAFRVTKLDLTHATKLSDHDNHIESTSVPPDHTRSQETEILSKEDLDHLKRMNRVPVQTGSGVNQYYFLTKWFNPHRCRHHRHCNPGRFVGVNEVGFATLREGVDEVGFATVEEDEGIELKEAVNEEEIKEYEHDEDREKHILKKIGIFLGYF